ncbi:GerAB/ArcD/ProY family transporter [Clostridium hydrogenum]|uniref:GerAB/ArcD/ProY family transporter n=1 Tax=Clostridium hydrogenum TaxID=2855764 RepID=UPI001F38AB38|nr:GerAB/ArcD/ProY family transporter [Clostridium hydrogenum]
MKTKISTLELLASIMVFENGTAILFYLASDTKQDAWITILIYIIPAIILQLIYTSLWYNYPNDNIITYSPKIFGKYIGFFLSIVYILYFIYGAARVLRDFSELMLISTLPKLPLTLVSFILITVICYATFTGIEVLCRIAVVFLCIFLSFFTLSFIFLSTTPNALHLTNLKPIMHNSLLFLIIKGWPLITFPFGESLLFSMFYTSVTEPKKVRKYTIMATIFEGFILSFNCIMFLSTLGVKLASTSLFPLLQTFRTIHAGSAFDRLDIFIILMLLLGGFFKIGFFIYGAMLGTASLVKINNPKYLSIPISIIVLISSGLIASNYPQHVNIGLDFTIKYIHLPMLIILPILALIIVNIKKFVSSNNQRGRL